MIAATTICLLSLGASASSRSAGEESDLDPRSTSGAAVGVSILGAATETEPRMPLRLAGVGLPLASTSSSEVGVAGFVAKDSVRPPRCRSARTGLAWYRMRYSSWLARFGAAVEGATGRKPRNCADARYLAKVWRARSFQKRRTFERWLDARTLDETPYDGRHDPWPANVHEVQVVFPGSAPWVLSCSDAEGWSPGLDYWQTYGGGRYYPGFEERYVVGGPGQFKWPTFKGMYRRGLEYLLAKGYRVPVHLRDPGDVRAWLSPLAQAIAMGAAHNLGLRGHHWSASYGRGC